MFFHPDSRLHLSQQGRFHAVSFKTASRDAQTLNCLNWSRNVSKFYAWQVVSLMNEHGKANFVVKADPPSTIRNNKLIAQGEKLETSAKLWVLVSNISSPRSERRYTRFFFFLYFATSRTACSHSFFFAVHVGILHVFKEIQLRVISIKSHGKSLLFGYYKPGFCCLELNLFFASLLRFERL